MTVIVNWTLICASDLELLKMANFTNEEYADILICYGYCNCVSLQARQEYIARFPGRRIPDISVSTEFTDELERLALSRGDEQTWVDHVLMMMMKRKIMRLFDDFDWIGLRQPTLLPENLESHNGKCGLTCILPVSTRTTTRRCMLSKKEIL